MQHSGKIFAFRVDASLQIGTGHVMRCLTLADILRAKGAEVRFICRRLEGNLIDFIQSKEYPVFILEPGNTYSPSYGGPLAHAHWLGATQEEDALACKLILSDIQLDWLIVDHYALDYWWEEALKDGCRKMMVIDDLADRRHNCDLLLDQTFGRKDEDYRSLVPASCFLLLGSRYAMLRPEFAEWRNYSLKRRASSELNKLLVSLGGADPNNVTGQVMEALGRCDFPEDFEVIVVMGLASPHLESVKMCSESLPFSVEVLANVSNMAQLMANADLAIGAAGATTWERCCLGLPSILLVLADNQKKIADILSIEGIVEVHPSPMIPWLCTSISKIRFDLASVAKKAAMVTDGMGGKRVVDTMEMVG